MLVLTSWWKNIFLICPNPSLTPGHPDLQRKESPTERNPQPLPSKGAAPCTGGQSWTGRLSEPPIRKTSCCESAKGSEDDFIAVFAPHLPPQRQHLSPSPASSWAEGPRCRHQQSITSCLCLFGAWIWNWPRTVICISRNKSRKVHPCAAARGSCTSQSNKSRDKPCTLAKVNSLCFALSKDENEPGRLS